MKKLLSIILVCFLMMGSTALAGVMIVASTPTYDESDAMAQNLDRAIDLLNGKVIVKGQPFSFNDVIGARTAENGFALAPNGNGVSVMGGGVSQIATTLHLALKELGEDVVFDEMYLFGDDFTAKYVENALDAVRTDYPRDLDYRFTSNYAENLAISMWRADTTVFCQLTGIGDATVAPNDAPEPEETPEPEAAPTPEPTAEPQADYKTMYVVNVTSFVNLRKEPSTSADVLKQIPKNASVQSIGKQDGDFMQVIYDNETGFVHSDYLSVENPNPVMLKVINCETSVTLRKAASTSSKKLASIPLGETVEYLKATEDGFRKVRYGKKTGYVMATYLTDPEQ